MKLVEIYGNIDNIVKYREGEISMKAIEIRNKYLDFFKRHGHAIIPSAPLVPENDSSVLFTTAGMQPLVPYLLGEPHPMGCKR